MGTKEMLGGHNPFLPVETLDGLIYPFITQPTRFVIPVPAIHYAVELGYQIKLIKGLRYREAPILEDYFSKLFEMKQDASAKGLQALTATAKVLINSGYGIWGFN